MANYIIVFRPEGAVWYYNHNLPVARVPRRGFTTEYLCAQLFQEACAYRQIQESLDADERFEVVEDRRVPLSVYAGPEIKLLWE